MTERVLMRTNELRIRKGGGLEEKPNEMEKTNTKQKVDLDRLHIEISPGDSILVRKFGVSSSRLESKCRKAGNLLFFIILFCKKQSPQ